MYKVIKLSLLHEDKVHRTNLTLEEATEFCMFMNKATFGGTFIYEKE